MKSVAVIDDPAAAEASLDPIRTRLLAELTEPRSATMLAATIGLPRQQVNYHLKTLERHGLVELVEERRKGTLAPGMLADVVVLASDIAAAPIASPDGVVVAATLFDGKVVYEKK